MVSYHQELLVGFIPPLVLSIFLQDEFQKWGPQICYMEGRIWFSFNEKKKVVPQTATPYFANLISNFGTMIG